MSGHYTFKTQLIISVLPACKLLLCLCHVLSLLMTLAPQLVSGYYALPYFITAHNSYSWLFSLWVAIMPCHICMPVHACTWLFRLWVAAVPCHSLGLFVIPLFGSPGSEWLLCLAIFHACSWCLFLALQIVSGHFALQYFMPAHDAYSWLFREWVATLPCNISCLLTCSWLFSLWVATLPCNFLCLLMMLVLDSPASEWLLCLPIFHVCSWCLFLALQPVSGYLPCNISCLLMMLVLGSPESEWLLCLAIFHACSLMPILGSPVCEGLLCLTIFHACSWCVFLVLQEVSGYFALQCLVPAHDAYSWLSRMWVATLPYNISYLLMMLVLDSPVCEWLLCLAIFHACSWCLFLAL